MLYRTMLDAARQVAIAAGLMLLSSLPAWPQASQVPNAKQQFIGPTGAAYDHGKVFMYVPNTFTKKNTWTGPDQSTPNTNPIDLDSAGRAVIWGVGSYRQVLFDKNNQQVWDNLTIAPPTASTAAVSGAGDFLPLGAILPIAGFTAPTNYLLAFGQAISRVTYVDVLAALTISSAASCISGNPTVTGITSTAQMRVGAPVEASCLSSGTTIASIAGPTSITVTPNAAVTGATTVRVFNWGNGDGVNTFNVPDVRGRVLPGADAMGGTAAVRLTSTYYGVSATIPGAASSSPAGESNYLTVPNLPPYTPSGTNSTPTVVVSNGASLTQASPGSKWSGGGNEGINAPTVTAALSGPPVFTGTAQGGTSTPFSIIQPSLTVNYAVKVLNGTLPTVGVLSLGGLTGDILCGVGVTCVGNTISFGGISFGTMASQNANAVAITGGTITGMPTPSNPTDVAIKSYVDAVAVGRTPLAPVRLATIAVLSNTPTYANGAAGVGATLTAGSNGVLSIDGVAVALNDRVLVKDQASAFQNGPYSVTTLGTVSVPYVLTRVTDADTAAELPNGLTGLITAGSTLANSSWTLNQPSAITVGTTALPWVQTGSPAVSYWTLSGTDIYSSVAGNVGIGTTTPVGKFEVVYPNSFTVAPFFSTNTDNADSQVIVGRARSSGRAGSLLFTDNTDGVSGTLSMLAYGDSLPNGLTLKKGGNVGIGTVSPVSPFGFSKMLGIRGASDASVYFDVGGTSRFEVGAGSAGAFLGMLDSLPMRFVTNGAENMRLTSGGALGVGTTTPVAGSRLSVSGSQYLVAVDPTMQQAICYGFGGGNCETNGFLSHVQYTGAAVTTGTAIRGEVDMYKAGATALGTSGVVTNVNSGSNSELVGVIGVADWHNSGSGNAIWAITEGTNCGGSNTLCGAISATNGGSFAPSWGVWCAFEGTATQSYDTCFKGEGFVTYGLRLSNSNTAPWPIYINNNVGAQIYGVNSAGVVTSASDARLKNDKGLIVDGALGRIGKLQPRKFAWKSDANQIETEGFFAQEVENVIPSAVTQTEDGSGFLMLNQLPVLAEAVKAIQELKAENDNLRACQNSWKCRIFGIR